MTSSIYIVMRQNSKLPDHSPDASDNNDSRMHLTASQAKALTALSNIVSIAGSNNAGGIRPRTKPLLHGRSGCGKSAVVRRLGDLEKLPLLEINGGSWIVFGAFAQPTTLTLIKNFVRQYVRGIIFLDEIDKCLPSGVNAWNTSWNLSVTAEILALLDAGNRLESAGWSVPEIERLKQYIIVAAGAWQRNHGPKKTEKNPRKNIGIPEEIFFRFNQRIIEIELPSRKDFVEAITRLHKEFALECPATDQLNLLATQAVESRVGMRWLEQYVTDLLILHPHLRIMPITDGHKTKEIISSAALAGATESFFKYVSESHREITLLCAYLIKNAKYLVVDDPDELQIDDGINANNFKDYLDSLIEAFRLPFSVETSERQELFRSFGIQVPVLRKFLQNIIIEKAEFLGKENIFDLVVGCESRLSCIQMQYNYIYHHLPD